MRRKLALALTCLPLVSKAVSAAQHGERPDEHDLNDLIKRYVDATNTHDFSHVEPLLTADAVYLFNQRAMRGVAEIKPYFEDAWRRLPDEVYGIENVQWLSVDHDSATGIYEYTYHGNQEGKVVAGRGRGTTLLLKRDGQWRIAHEHL